MRQNHKAHWQREEAKVKVKVKVKVERPRQPL